MPQQGVGYDVVQPEDSRAVVQQQPAVADILVYSVVRSGVAACCELYHILCGRGGARQYGGDAQAYYGKIRKERVGGWLTRSFASAPDEEAKCEICKVWHRIRSQREQEDSYSGQGVLCPVCQEEPCDLCEDHGRTVAANII